MNKGSELISLFSYILTLWILSHSTSVSSFLGLLILPDICNSRRLCSFPEYFGNNLNHSNLQGIEDSE